MLLLLYYYHSLGRAIKGAELWFERVFEGVAAEAKASGGDGCFYGCRMVGEVIDERYPTGFSEDGLSALHAAIRRHRSCYVLSVVAQVCQ